jgi:hypothetical protein
MQNTAHSAAALWVTMASAYFQAILQASLRGRKMPEPPTPKAEAPAPTDDEDGSERPRSTSSGEQPTSTSSGKERTGAAGPAIGGSIGAVVLLGAAVAAFIFWKQRRKAQGAHAVPLGKDAYAQSVAPAPVYGNLHDVRPSTLLNPTSQSSIELLL